MTEKAILFDSTRCVGCRGCQSACKQWNGLGSDDTHNSGSYENPPALTSDTWIKIRFREMESNGSIDWIFTRQSCMHCTDAACVSVCSSDALKHHPDGFVIYDKDHCTGCAYCVEACPFDDEEGQCYYWGTDENGSYTIFGVPVGEYRVHNRWQRHGWEEYYDDTP